jgi:geranylgeranyl pyrophosphate synthase
MTSNTLMIISELQRRSKKGLDYAKQTMRQESIRDQTIHDALEHYLENWNDYTHSGLFSLACEAVGGNLDAAVPVQASLSMIAAAFDLHDDIIDKSSTKNGKTTVYGKFGAETTLLLGNAFILEGFALLGNAMLNLKTEKLGEVFRIVKNSLFDIGNAHALELSLRGNAEVDADQYWNIINDKAASIDADMRIGAIIGGGTEKEVQALSRYGRIIGILTILREEFIDIFEIDELTQRSNVKSLPIPILLALNDPATKIQINQLLSKNVLTSEDVDNLLDLLYSTKEITQTKIKMSSLFTEAITIASHLQNQKNIIITIQLNELANSLLEDL